jgi:hypothetical protein
MRHGLPRLDRRRAGFRKQLSGKSIIPQKSQREEGRKRLPCIAYAIRHTRAVPPGATARASVLIPLRRVP